MICLVKLRFVFIRKNGIINNMKREFPLFLSLVIVALPAYADSFLKAQSFPKTFDDLSFVSRMEFMMDDYSLYEPEYDENGVCISGCAYPGITIKEDMDAVDFANAQMADLLNQNQQTTPGETSPHQHEPGVTPHQPDNNGGHQNTNWCNNGLSTKLPLRYPVDMSNFKYRISSDFGFRPSSSNGAEFHPALDIACPKGTPVYATADGVVDTVANQKTPGGAGWYVNIRHDNGLISQYLHLDNVLVKKGDVVKACQQIALSGNSGISKKNTPYAAHLDYRIRFSGNQNTFVDILCPCRAANRNTKESSNSNLNTGCAHSLFNANYKFQPYDPNSNDIKRSLWRVGHGHCMQTFNDLLPDEVR